ncbi:MAG: extracellular solute-binding protein [Anaerolineae bacterium]|nr:extracellular solute-binding protein [Anaerolineae bacterium]
MVVDRTSPIPLYYQLKLHIRKQMESGELHPGDRLPTEMELCELFSISRAPVRQALTELAREGLIYRRAGQGSFVSPIAPASLDQKTAIRVLAHYDVRWMASLEEAIHSWNSLHPEHEVHLNVTMCSRDEYHQSLRRAVAQGNAPDIVPLDYVWMMDYAHNGYITPLNNLDSLWVDEIMQDFELPVVKNNTVNGLLYGVPVQADITGMWYRKDWFVQEGLTPPTTWSAWLETLDYFAKPEVLKRLGHRYSVVMPVSAAAGEATVNLLIAFLWMTGGDVFGAGGELSLDTPAVHKALRFLQEITLERRAYLPEKMAAYPVWDLVRLFVQDEVPMALGGTYEWPRIREECEWADDEQGTAEHLGFVLLPRPSEDTPPVASLGGTSWAILQQSEIQDLCLEVLKLASSSVMSLSFCNENLQISPHRSVNRQFRNAEQHPWLSKLVSLLPKSRIRPLVYNYLQTSLLLQQMFEQTLWQGMPIEETVKRTVQFLGVLLGK